MVSDFGTEIVAVAEALLTGKATKAVERFVETYFEPRPVTMSEFIAQEKEHYVSREELIKADLRMANEAGLDGEYIRNLRRLLNSGGDAYVHGAYETAMEPYNGGRHQFMLNGHESPQAPSVQRVIVAGKLHEVVYALALMAESLGDAELGQELRAALKELDDADECSGPTVLEA